MDKQLKPIFPQNLLNLPKLSIQITPYSVLVASKERVVRMSLESFLALLQENKGCALLEKEEECGSWHELF